MNPNTKQLLIFAVFLLSAMMGFSQQTIKSWEYWYDGNIGSRTVVVVSPVAELNLSQNVAANTLTSGFHVINLRFKDDSARYSSAISQHFYKSPVLSCDTNKITAYEYWIDNDISNRISQGITPQNKPQVVAGLNLSAISAGFHLFNIRFKDERKIWSSAQSQYFYKAPVVSGTENKIESYEYWIDNDYAGKVLVNVSPQNTLQLLTGANLASITPGFHVFNIRFKDEMKLWSQAQSYHFYKSPVVPGSENRITAYEYWFDMNYAGKVFTAVTPQNQLQLITGIDASALSDGFHLFNIRFRDERGMWSAAHTGHFYSGGNITGIPNAVNGYRYWFDNNLTTLTTVSLSNTINPANLNELINTAALDTGNHIIDMQFRDLQGDWSSAVRGTFFRTCAGNTATISANGPISFCAGDSVILTASAGLNYQWNTGQSSQSITVYNSALEYVTVTNYSGCVANAGPVQVTMFSLPVVTMAPFNPGTICINYLPLLLSGGSPGGVGGVYSGNGVAGGSFYPSVAGPGSHVITYTFTDNHNCSNSASASIFVDQCVGVDNNKNTEGLYIYPNPAHDLITLQVGTVLLGSSYILSDILGRTIVTGLVNTERTSVNLNGLSEGVYLLKVSGQDQRTLRLIKH